ncbi:hypothetical protein BV898_16514 [Hypsibius exemplaris]|uniref:Uncharacterized protein n=1 Tax=Hypsibius exemplaris TaxID=2072580 RepID=A0A9X6RL59_HYPEX|nr:hypothetical protein BV898_16514 [Hypsibius exemplaris]
MMGPNSQTLLCVLVLVALVLQDCVCLRLSVNVNGERVSDLVRAEAADSKVLIRRTRDGHYYGYGYGGGMNPIMMILPLLLQNPAAARQDTPGAAAAPAPADNALLMSLLGSGATGARGYHSD